MSDVIVIILTFFLTVEVQLTFPIFISIMQHGHFQDAIKTFKDALSFMSECITMELGDVAGNPYRSSSDDDEASPLNEVLRLAISRLVFSQKNPSSHDVIICPFDEGDITSMISALQCVPKVAARFLVRLRCEGSLSTQQDMNLPSAAMMHNFGLARLLAYEHGPQPKPKKACLLQDALCSLSAAHSMIQRHMMDKQPADKNIVYDRLRPLLLDAVVLTNLFRVHWHTNQTDAANDVMTTLTSLLNEVQIHQDYLLSRNVEMGNHKIASAA